MNNEPESKPEVESAPVCQIGGLQALIGIPEPEATAATQGNESKDSADLGIELKEKKRDRSKATVPNVSQ